MLKRVSRTLFLRSGGAALVLVLLAACGTAGSAAPNPTQTTVTDTMTEQPTQAAMTDTMAEQPTQAAMADTMAEQPTQAAMTDTMAEQPTQAAMTDLPADMMVSRWQGNFVAGSVPADSVRGMAEIVHNEDGSYTLKLTNFESSRGPDVLVMLAPGAMPGDDMHMYKEIAQLAHPTGDQEYQLPAGLEPAAFGSVVIWCRSANAIFGYATLMPEQHG